VHKGEQIFLECQNKIDINFEPHKEGDDKV
jgi:hypothetical protein